MTNLYQWAARWGIPPAALAELQRECLGLEGTPGDDPHVGKTESFSQSQIVLEAARKGVRLWRNNVGVLRDESGRPVRYGLANQSKQMNEIIKSGDLIGIRPVLVTPAHVGHVIGQFVSREAKAPGWHYSGRDREVAQLNWANLICSMGGDAAFATGEGSL
ncbi:MAG TPA: hypothetical protein VNT52_18415 [Acidimicrobiales bacterium]|nr:hypothetical protein [Acidimicrobiales bacterium]